MRKFKMLPILVGLLALMITGCEPYQGADAIPLIAYDTQGRPVQVKVPPVEYESRLEKVASTYHDSSLAALQRVDARGGKWSLRAFTIGVAGSVDVGIGPLRLGAVPRFRLFFSNSSDLVYP